MKRPAYVKRKPVDMGGVLISKSGKAPLAPANGSVTLTFDQCVEKAREIMRRASADAARILGQQPPKLVETKLPNGAVRIVTEWPDGEQTNECLVEPLGDQRAFSG